MTSNVASHADTLAESAANSDRFSYFGPKSNQVLDNVPSLFNEAKDDGLRFLRSLMNPKIDQHNQKQEPPAPVQTHSSPQPQQPVPTISTLDTPAAHPTEPTHQNKPKKSNKNKRKRTGEKNERAKKMVIDHKDDCRETPKDDCDFDQLMALYESAGSKKPEVSKKKPKPKPKIKKAKKTALPVKTEQKRDNQDMVDKKEKLPCRYWTNNRCQQGDKCPFLHEGQPLVTVCRYFKSNSCYNGESCPFSHDLKLEPCRFFHVKGVCENGAICPFSHEPLTRDLRRRLHQSTGPCRFFHFKGFCNDGEECLFSHEPINADQRADLESTLELCKHYHLSGACKKGDDCFFLHGEASKRARQRFMENHKANNLKPQAPFNQELE